MPLAMQADCRNGYNQRECECMTSKWSTNFSLQGPPATSIPSSFHPSWIQSLILSSSAEWFDSSVPHTSHRVKSDVDISDRRNTCSVSWILSYFSLRFVVWGFLGGGGIQRPCFWFNIYEFFPKHEQRLPQLLPSGIFLVLNTFHV
jgi:hypothetical protein